MANNLINLDPPAPTATVIDRVRYLIKLMRRTQAEFSRLVDYDPTNMSKILSGKLPVSDNFINRLVANLGVSKEWLVNGTDVPFPRSEPVHEIHDTELRVAESGAGTPVYDIDVTAGSTQLSRMFTDERIIGRLNLPGLDPTHPVVRVSGESMTPVVRNGAYVQLRPINNKAIIFWGQIYVVELEDYRMVKYVRKHPDDRNMIILHSANPDFDDIEVPKSEIYSLYLVEIVFNFDILA